MLIDNKTQRENFPKTLIEFFQKYLATGSLETVTGYFSVPMLAYAFENFNAIENYKLVLGNLVKTEKDNDKIVNLLLQEEGLFSTLNLSEQAKKAVDFLRQEIVQVKTVRPNFCHAKSYVFTSKDNDAQKSFFIMGSSNFTESGLGLYPSSNVELNYADFGGSSDYKEIKNWFNNLWKSEEAKTEIEVESKKISYKDYLIELISKLFKEYSPQQLYYKVLYELFREELIDFDPQSLLSKQIEHLRDTTIYNVLYPFQQKGVLSLIQKLQNYNGAILADAVGLGKTWQALAVMKYFEIQGYRTFLFCPKKLEHNWRRYLEGHDSKFESDKLRYTIRYHTDLQDERINGYDDGFTLDNHFKNNPKILIIIDESHNLRNDKSIRYKFLVDNILSTNKDVKVLMLSATPINTKLLDIRNQFKLMVKGDDKGFENSEFEISSLQSLFANAQKDFNEWQELGDRRISVFINKLPQHFFSLADAVIVARTRELIKKTTENDVFEFPKKEKPTNVFVSPKSIGSLKSFEEILDALSINLTAYKPAQYTSEEKVKSVLEDEKQRQKFLVKMMYILMIKRLESSWHSFKITVNNILEHHKNALDKVNEYLKTKKEEKIELEFNESDTEDLTEIANDLEQQNGITYEDITLGKKNPIPISSITQINLFKKHLEEDIEKFNSLMNDLNELFKKTEDEKRIPNNYKSVDNKLEKLIELILDKRKERENKKVLIFTVYTDTAKYLFEQLKARGFTRIAYVSGSEGKSDDGYSSKNFEPILERFAPYTKLFNEKDWSKYYRTDGILKIENFDDWKNYIITKDIKLKEQIENPIDILISTDCLSEGQNLQDCDCVINYDIHWNPVRLIQRMGRIDRLASPNKSIMGMNFWPADSYEQFLTLRKRVEERMALLSIVGAEIDPNISPDMEEITKGNPLISHQEEKMLEQLQISWDDIEDNSETLGFDKFSLETFRQELYELYQQKRKELEAIPNGVYTGFKQKLDVISESKENALVALIGYPKRNIDENEYKYEKLHLIYADGILPPKFINDVELLNILRQHKSDKRLVPNKIDKMDKKEIKNMQSLIKDWLNWKTGKTTVESISDLFEKGVTEQTKPKVKKIEDIYKEENFDLITWFVISKD
ncbi:MAG: DEAD/DEAH box helicase family protein [Ignavibacteriales bacterium]|nr:DEAD/DEAH box helicase family protein [Ignavibacteriales bacterium]